MYEKVITLGGGCFWCIEAAYMHLKGVYAIESGYSGGDPKRITYKEVCTGTTGHLEVVQIVYNDQIIDTKTLLEIFFTLHNPTETCRQQRDQYRSVIFYHDDEQKQTAKHLVAELTENKMYGDGNGNGKILTTIEKFNGFYPAEIDHQDYFNKNPNENYCKIVIIPKLSKIKKEFKSYQITD